MSNQTQEQERKSQNWSAHNGGIDAHTPQPSRHWLRLMFKNLSLLTTGGLLMGGLVLMVGFWRGGTQFLDGLRAVFTVSELPAKVDVRSIVVQQIRGASELTTAIYAMESVVPASRERAVGGYVIGKTTLLYIAHGEVRAGVDLTALRPEDVQVNGNALSLRLPPPKILDSKIDVTRSKVYDYDRGFMGLGPDVAPELQELAQQETLAKIVESACTDGLLKSANDRAKIAVSQLLMTAGYTQIAVETQAPTPENCIVPSPVPSDTISPTPVLENPGSALPESLPETQPTLPSANSTPPSAIPSAIPSPIPSALPANPPNVPPGL